MTSSILCYNIEYLRHRPGLKSRAFIFGPYIGVKISQNRKRSYCIRETPRRLGIQSIVQPGTPPPPEPPSGSWTKWIIGALINFAFPYLRSKWGAFLIFTKKVETAIETIDNVVETIEEVAEKVNKVAEDIANELPQGGKIKGAIERIENVAEEIVKDTRFVDEILDKVEEINEELDSFMIEDKGTLIPEEVKDQN